LEIKSSKKAGRTKKPLHEYDPLSEEYAALSVDEVDRLAFGFCESDIQSIDPNQLNIRWKGDIENVEHEVAAFVSGGKGPEDWANAVDLSEPIQLSFEGGKFFIEDGHHRYMAAYILKKRLNVDEVVFKDNPYHYARKVAGLPSWKYADK